MRGPYRSVAFNRAWLKGRDAAALGYALSTNPYRRRGLVRDPRRGSWSETWSRAWARGWQSVRDERARAGRSPAHQGAT